MSGREWELLGDQARLSQNQEGKIAKGHGLNAERQRRNEQLLGDKTGEIFV